MLPTNKEKRDAILTERVKAIGGALVKVESTKYSSNLTSYHLYVTFEDDPGPPIYDQGQETRQRGYCLTFNGAESLNVATEDPKLLRFVAWDVRRNSHEFFAGMKERREKLDWALSNYQRKAGEVALAIMRGTLTVALCDEHEDAKEKLAERVKDHDEARWRIDQMIDTKGSTDLTPEERTKAWRATSAR